MRNVHSHKQCLYDSLFFRSSPTLVIACLLHDSSSDMCEVISNCSFDLHFPDDLWCWISFHVPAGCLIPYDYTVSSVTESCLTLCDPMDCCTPSFPVYHQLLEFTQTHVHRIGDAIQPSHPLSSPSPPAPNPSQHQSLFQWVRSLHEVAKVLEFQPQPQSFQWTPRTDLL